MPRQHRPDLQRFLDRLTSRSILTEEEQQAVLDLPGHAEQVHANRDFVTLGERVDHATLIVAGMVGRFDQNGEGSRQITAIHLPGNMCDLHSVVQPVPTSALQALSTSTILRVSHRAIRGAAARFPALAEALWRDCMVDAAILSEWVVNVGNRDARKRIAHFLCEMACRLKVRPQGKHVVLDLYISQQQLAEATAMTPVHVNRTLQGMRADGLVDWRTRIVRLPDWERLCEVGEFDPTYLQADIQPAQRMRIMEAAA